MDDSGTAPMIRRDQTHFGDEDLEAAEPSQRDIRIVNWRRLMEGAAKRLGKDAANELERAAKEIGTSFDPPPYNGVSDENPITFLVKHYHLRIRQQNYYQADLYRDDEKLFHALRNIFKNRDWLEYVESADFALIKQGFSPYILGKRIKSARKLCDILPGRKNIEPKQTLTPPGWRDD